MRIAGLKSTEPLACVHWIPPSNTTGFGLPLPMVYPEAERRALARYLEAPGDPAERAEWIR